MAHHHQRREVSCRAKAVGSIIAVAVIKDFYCPQRIKVLYYCVVTLSSIVVMHRDCETCQLTIFPGPQTHYVCIVQGAWYGTVAYNISNTPFLASFRKRIFV